MSKKRLASTSERAPEIIRLLSERHADAHCELNFSSAYELIVAVILSAQCTDKQVNKVTPALFAAYPDSQALAAADPEDVEKLIYSTGFYRNKTKHLLAMAQRVVDVYSGAVPDTMKDLTSLAGVGRKTANVVLGDGFEKQEGFIVDTHVKRIVRRLGWTRHTDPNKIERVLMKLVPRERWTFFAHVLVFHGRRICDARKPRCEDCPVSQLCPSSEV